MTLLIAGHFDLDPDHVDRFMAAAVDMMKATHAEDGCIEYRFTRDELEQGRVLVFEKWESGDALAAHFKAPHMATFGAVMRELDVRAMEVLKYEVASEGPVRG